MWIRVPVIRPGFKRLLRAVLDWISQTGLGGIGNDRVTWSDQILFIRVRLNRVTLERRKRGGVEHWQN